MSAFYVEQSVGLLPGEYVVQGLPEGISATILLVATQPLLEYRITLEAPTTTELDFYQALIATEFERLVAMEQPVLPEPGVVRVGELTPWLW